jgi:hypothetical protein
MTATFAPTQQARPRIAYFWWLREARNATPIQTTDAPSYLATDRNYIPASTADLWRRGAPRPLR